MKTGEKLRFLRQFNDFNQKQMAKKLAMEVRSYNNLENDKVKVDVERIEQIAKVFGMEVSLFINIKNLDELKSHLSNNNYPIQTSSAENIRPANFDDKNFEEINNYINNVGDLAKSFSEQSQITARLIGELHKLKIQVKQNPEKSL